MHQRLSPKRHGFVYRIFMFLLDLDELDAVRAAVPFFGVNETNVFSLDDRDYFQFHSRGIRANLETFLQSQGFGERPARVELLTLPRLFGYTFNPISVFFCYGDFGRPLVSVIQVGNTFGELKPYLVPVGDGGGFHARLPKDYYVSPFSDLGLEFDFRFGVPGAKLRVAIDEYRGGEKVLLSSLAGERLELTAANALWMALKYPFVTLKVIFLIHWEALRLWSKRIPYRLKETDPTAQRGAFRSV
jgi:DUF1365 family protein